MVDIKAETRLPRFVSLNELKANPALADMQVIKRGQRLSIQPVTAEEWAEVLAMAERPGIGDDGMVMDAPITQNNLEIEVQDFGPIVHAKIDLRPMTVFIGPSNTGKSYLAVLIYALHRFFAGVGQTPLGIRRFAFWRSQFGHTVPEPTEEIIAAYVQLAQKVSDARLGQQDAGIALPDPIIEIAPLRI